MRITIEPTTKEQVHGTGNPETQYPKLILEYPHDHIDIHGWMDIFKSILFHLGFPKETSDTFLGKEEE